MTRIRSAESINLDATTRVEVNDTSLRLANVTTAQRDALTAADGDMIYNSTTNQFNIRISGAWVQLATVEGLVDSAPTTLDTLNELAAALGDDPNFATTTANNIATKLPLAGGTMSGDINGNGNKVLFANVYSQLSDLPSASTYHGMFAHVHATGKGYFAHAGAWIELANQSDLNTTNTNLTSIDNGKLNLSGGTMTGTLTLNGAPSSANHAATKAYVDSAIASSGGGSLEFQYGQHGASGATLNVGDTAIIKLLGGLSGNSAGVILTRNLNGNDRLINSNYNPSAIATYTNNTGSAITGVNASIISNPVNFMWFIDRA